MRLVWKFYNFECCYLLIILTYLKELGLWLFSAWEWLSNKTRIFHHQISITFEKCVPIGFKICASRILKSIFCRIYRLYYIRIPKNNISVKFAFRFHLYLPLQALHFLWLVGQTLPNKPTLTYWTQAITTTFSSTISSNLLNHQQLVKGFLTREIKKVIMKVGLIRNKALEVKYIFI